MTNWIKVAATADVAPGHIKPVVADGTPLVLANVSGTLYAFEETCPHKGAPFAEGMLKGNELVCLWHGWRFDLCTGKAVRGNQDARTYPVKVENDEVFVAVA